MDEVSWRPLAQPPSRTLPSDNGSCTRCCTSAPTLRVPNESSARHRSISEVAPMMGCRGPIPRAPTEWRDQCGCFRRGRRHPGDGHGSSEQGARCKRARSRAAEPLRPADPPSQLKADQQFKHHQHIERTPGSWVPFAHQHRPHQSLGQRAPAAAKSSRSDLANRSDGTPTATDSSTSTTPQPDPPPTTDLTGRRGPARDASPPRGLPTPRSSRPHCSDECVPGGHPPSQRCDKCPRMTFRQAHGAGLSVNGRKGVDEFLAPRPLSGRSGPVAPTRVQAAMFETTVWSPE